MWAVDFAVRLGELHPFDRSTRAREGISLRATRGEKRPLKAIPTLRGAHETQARTPAAN
jgi:hypothetical protein